MTMAGVRTLSVSLRASSVANFFTYSATFFLYSSGLKGGELQHIKLELHFFSFSNPLNRIPVKVHGCCIAVQGVGGVGVGEQLREG